MRLRNSNANSPPGRKSKRATSEGSPASQNTLWQHSLAHLHCWHHQTNKGLAAPIHTHTTHRREEEKKDNNNNVKHARESYTQFNAPNTKAEAKNKKVKKKEQQTNGNGKYPQQKHPPPQLASTTTKAAITIG